MNKFIIISVLSALYSTTSIASSGLADRINELRSYPNKVEIIDNRKQLCRAHKRLHIKMNKAGIDDHYDMKDIQCSDNVDNNKT